MNGYQAGPGFPAPVHHSGLTPAAAVLLWIFVGWPMSWILLFVFSPLGLLFGIAITVAMIVIVSSSGSRPRPIVINNVPAMPFPPPVPPRHVAIRREVESLAAITPIGGCGWCGSLAAHLDAGGHPVPPRHWHSAEIEERIRFKLRY